MRTIAFLLTTVVGLLCCRNHNTSTLEKVEAETVNSTRQYEYADPLGKRVIVQNGLPRSIEYTDPNKMKHGKLLFWTRIINETDKPIELNINFPVEYEVPAMPGRYYQVLIPADTMALDKVSLADFGIDDLKSFLDSSMSKPAALQRTIAAKASGGFYVALLCDSSIFGPFRTGLSIKGQQLIYKIARYTGPQGVSLVDEKEITCGSINLNNLVRVR